MSLFRTVLSAGRWKYGMVVLYGPDPNKFFCGSPYDEESYGIYARGLQKALAKAAGDHYEFLDETGTS